jgi:hypothetical protein
MIRMEEYLQVSHQMSGDKTDQDQPGDCHQEFAADGGAY